MINFPKRSGAKRSEQRQNSPRLPSNRSSRVRRAWPLAPVTYVPSSPKSGLISRESLAPPTCSDPILRRRGHPTHCEWKEGGARPVRSGWGRDVREPAGGAPGGGAAADGSGGSAHGGAHEGPARDARHARGPWTPPRAVPLRRRRARRHGVHQRLPVRHRLLLPCCSNHFAMSVELFTCHCGHTCIARQTLFTKSPGCLPIYYWRRDHSSVDLRCSMLVGRHHCLDW